MKRRMLFASLAAGAIAVSGMAAALPGASAMPAHGSAGTHAVHVCASHPRPGYAACTAMVVVNGEGKVVTTAQPGAFTPVDVQKAYNLKGLKSHGATVALVDAFAYPNLVSDLTMFRKQFKLPACTQASGCLTILNQRGGTKPPVNQDPNWQLEQALDVDMVSSACPDCKILMVQGDKNSFRDLEAAENIAAMQKGVVAISNSYGGGQGRNNAAYNHPGIAITASTGDDGYAPVNLYPASDTNVVAVGGTAIVANGSRRGYTESAWSGAGSGCSTKNAQPKWQQSVKTTCKFDATADVSGPASPGAGGLEIVINGHNAIVGGTSEASPMIAAVFALSGNTKGYPAKYVYAHTTNLYDITTGSNGSCGSPLCDAGKGWDGPTGLGTPHGVKGF